ncbi:hypothetical protein PAV_6c03400 [Paenibacillus alvei DSM 29]|nr:hypothetical protein PAV_6c03400 [Paenibacillus alvei DSM 29]
MTAIWFAFFSLLICHLCWCCYFCTYFVPLFIYVIPYTLVGRVVKTKWADTKTKRKREFGDRQGTQPSCIKAGFEEAILLRGWLFYSPNTFTIALAITPSSSS